MTNLRKENKEMMAKLANAEKRLENFVNREREYLSSLELLQQRYDGLKTKLDRKEQELLMAESRPKQQQLANSEQSTIVKIGNEVMKSPPMRDVTITVVPSIVPSPSQDSTIAASPSRKRSQEKKCFEIPGNAKTPASNLRQQDQFSSRFGCSFDTTSDPEEDSVMSSLSNWLTRKYLFLSKQ